MLLDGMQLPHSLRKQVAMYTVAITIYLYLSIYPSIYLHTRTHIYIYKFIYMYVCNSYNMGMRDLPDIYAQAQGQQA